MRISRHYSLFDLYLLSSNKQLYAVFRVVSGLWWHGNLLETTPGKKDLGIKDSSVWFLFSSAFFGLYQMLPATLQSGRWSWHTGCLVFKRSDQIKKIKWGQMSQKISVKNIDGHRNDVNQVLTIFRHLKRDYFI